MKLRSVLFLCLGMLVGAGCVMAWHSYTASDAKVLARNWQIVYDFTTIMRGESPSHTKLQDGMLITEYPTDPEPALAFLVSKGELGHVELVFPTVLNTRENNVLWMDFTYKHYPDILWVTGHTNMGAFKTTGDYPLHLSVWYKRTEHAEELIKELIHLLEASEAL